MKEKTIQRWTTSILEEGTETKLQAHLKHKSVIIFPDVTDESDPDRDFPVLKKIASGLKGPKNFNFMDHYNNIRGSCRFCK